jgi:carboxyl-terminal processing protease
LSPYLRARILLPLLALFLLLPGGLPARQWVQVLVGPPEATLAPAAVLVDPVQPLPTDVPTSQEPPAFEPVAFLPLHNPPVVTPVQEAGEAEKDPPVVEEVRLLVVPDIAIEAVETTEEVKRLQRGILADLWTVVFENYLYPDFNGADWQEARREQTGWIDAGISMDDFYLSLKKMVASLGDDHSTYLTPEQAVVEDAKYAGTQGFAGVGVYLVPFPERQRASLLAVVPGGAAEEAGLKPRDSILLVDGESILDENGKLRPLLRGPEGTLLEVVVQSPGEAERVLVMNRRRISGPLPLPHTVLEAPDGRRFGYILLISFGDSTIPSRLQQLLSSMNEDWMLDGIILDNRFNEGGADTVLKGVLSIFTGGLQGHFVGRRVEKPLEVESVDLNGSQHTPLVVLVSSTTFSYGEVFAGVLQESGRAYLIGEPTLGNVETLKGYNFKDGSRAWIAHTSFRPIAQPDITWEGRGIIPDLLVPADWDLHTLDSDPAVQAALQHLQTARQAVGSPQR